MGNGVCLINRCIQLFRNMTIMYNKVLLYSHFTPSHGLFKISFYWNIAHTHAQLLYIVLVSGTLFSLLYTILSFSNFFLKSLMYYFLIVKNIKKNSIPKYLWEERACLGFALKYSSGDGRKVGGDIEKIR